MAGYLGTKAVLLSTTAADVVGDAEIGGNLTAATADINGGTIDGTVIGAFAPAAISGTTGSFSGDFAVDTDTLFVDASTGNVGIGTSSPSAGLFVATQNSSVTSSIIGVGIGSTSNTAEVELFGSASGAALIDFAPADGSTDFSGRIFYSLSSDFMSFATNGTERMRIDASGNLLVGVSANPGGSFGQELFVVNTSGNTSLFRTTGGSGSGTALSCARTSNGIQISFHQSGSMVGSIYTTSTSTSYNTSSDYRLKEDVQPMTGASERVLALKPVNFAWKADGTRVDGFLAHEAQAVVPEAVTGTKDAMHDEEYELTPAVLDDEGNVVTEAVMGTRQVPDYQGIDQSKLVPLLTAALQEALTEITDLKARVAALEVV